MYPLILHIHKAVVSCVQKNGNKYGTINYKINVPRVNTLQSLSSCRTLRAVQSPALSGLVLSDTPCTEGVMFNITFTYFKTADVTWDVWFSRVILYMLQSQVRMLHFTKCTAIAIHSSASITSCCNKLSWHWASPGRHTWVTISSSSLLSSKYLCYFFRFYSPCRVQQCIHSLPSLVLV